MSPVVSLDRHFRDEIKQRVGTDERARIPLEAVPSSGSAGVRT
jgi:hypothetical protein